MANGAPGTLEIGKVLKEARQRAGLEIGAVEERTKIRTRYLRALEGEEWDVLPGHAYAKGFLRTYSQLLGLDSDAIVDEYRRRVEDTHAGVYQVPEPLLQARRPLDKPPRNLPSRGFAVAALVVALLVVLLVLGLTGGEGAR